jgi:hypothetical protein
VGPDDKPIPGVRVRLFEPKEPTRSLDSITDDAGQFSVGLTHAPVDVPLVITASKDGFKPYRQEFKAGARGKYPKRIVLEPDLNGRERAKN